MEKDITILDPHRRRASLIFSPRDLNRLHEIADVRWGHDEPMPPGEVEALREQVSIIITGRWRYGEVSRFPRLKAILEVSGGFPSIEDLDYETCFARGIRILSSAPAFGPAVAEMGLALALACARQVAWTDVAFRSGEPEWSFYNFETEIGTPFTLYGKQVGFIGFGGIARSLMPLLKPFGCPIQAYDPWQTNAWLSGQGAKPVELEELLATSRLVFVMAVPSKTNRALLDRQKLSLLDRETVFILLSRAQIVDFDALTQMLLEGRFRAGIDVFPEEPLPDDHPIRAARHAVLSSHRAGATADALLNIGRKVTDDLEAICSGLIPHAMQGAQPEFIRMRNL